jgi:hypothetical protein
MRRSILRTAFVVLECVCCARGGTTTLTGKVYDPAGRNPLYNALVYVPNAPLTPFDDDAGVTCDKCAGAVASGSPIVAAITAPDGTFKLTDVPAGVPLPLVIQVGKWRREVTLPPANPCVDNLVSDVGLTRLPRNSGEGHLPQMAHLRRRRPVRVSPPQDRRRREGVHPTERERADPLLPVARRRPPRPGRRGRCRRLDAVGGPALDEPRPPPAAS